MWTEAHRARHDARLKEMVSACAVREVARWLERADPPRSERRTPLLPVVGAIAWHLRAVDLGGPCHPDGRPGTPCLAGQMLAGLGALRPSPAGRRAPASSRSRAPIRAKPGHY